MYKAQGCPRVMQPARGSVRPVTAHSCQCRTCSVCKGDSTWVAHRSRTSASCVRTHSSTSVTGRLTTENRSAPSSAFVRLISPGARAGAARSCVQGGLKRTELMRNVRASECGGRRRLSAEGVWSGNNRLPIRPLVPYKDNIGAHMVSEKFARGRALRSFFAGVGIWWGEMAGREAVESGRRGRVGSDRAGLGGAV